MPTNAISKNEKKKGIKSADSQRVVQSVSMSRDLWDRLHRVAEAKRRKIGGRVGVSSVLMELTKMALPDLERQFRC